MNKHICYRFTCWGLLWLLAAAMVVMPACKKEGLAQPPAADTTAAQLMILQPNPFQRPVDLYSVYMDTAKLNAAPVAWPGLTRYVKAPSGNRWLFGMLAGTFANYFYYPFYFKPGASYTIYSITSLSIGPNKYAFIEDDLSAPRAGYAKIRMIQGRSLLAPNTDGPFDYIVQGGDTLAKKLGYRNAPLPDNAWPDTTSFRQLPAGDYRFEVKNSLAPYIYQTSLQATLQPGGIYTLITTGLAQPDSSLKTGIMLIQNK